MQDRLQHVIGLVDLLAGHRLNPQLITAPCLTAFFRGQCLVVGDIRFRFFKRFLITGLVNGEEHLILLHQLVIMHIDGSDQSRHIRGDRDDVGTKACVTRPWRLSVVNPRAKNSDEREDDQRHSNGGTGDFSC